MAANFTAPAPVEPEKQGTYLHDRSRIPAEPRPKLELFRPYGGMVLGLIFAIAFVSGAFIARDSWNAHRDWVVPATVPFLATAGIAMGHIVWRQRWGLFFPAFLLMLAVISLEVANFWRGAEVDGEDTARDVLAILSGITLGVLVAYLLVAVVWLELKHPTKAPEPQV